jgi:hypothetical protein
MIACSALPQTDFDFPETKDSNRPAVPTVRPLPLARMPAAVLPAANPLPAKVDRWTHAIPPFSLRLGVCESDTAGLMRAVPLYLDLQNPRTGSILVVGDEGCGKTRLMQSMVAGALHDHYHRELQAAVIAPHVRRWEGSLRRLAPENHSRVVPNGGWPAERVCLELAGLVEQRLEGDPSGPVILLVIDGLVPMLASSHNVQASLRFLIDQGPLVRIRPIISLSTHQALNLHYWVSLFRTSLIGQISSPGNASPLAAGCPLDVLPGCPGQFVAVGPAGSTHQWTRFWPVEAGVPEPVALAR